VSSPGEREQTIPFDKLLIDVGLSAEELPNLVRVGDLITMRRPLVELRGDMVAGKALDNRASVAAAIVCLEELTRLWHQWDVYIVATVQEEVGYHGAITSSYALKPDLAIAIDVTFAEQPGTPAEETYALGKGPTIGCGPNFHPKLQEALEKTARALELSYQIEPATRPGGTDAAAIQISREGIPTALLSIPVRNMHTPVETLSIKDVRRTGRLVAAFAAQLEPDYPDRLVWELDLDEAED
jgi:endoglucanase